MCIFQNDYFLSSPFSSLLPPLKKTHTHTHTHTLNILLTKRLNVRATGADLEDSKVTGRLELAEDEGAQDGGERAPVTGELTGLEAEGRFVEGADNGAITKGALVQGGAQMGADIGNTVDGAVVIGDEEKLEALGFDGDDVSGGDVGGLEEGHPLFFRGHVLDTDGAVAALRGHGEGVGAGAGEGGHCVFWVVWGGERV